MKSIYYHNEYVGCHACLWDRRDNPRGADRDCHFQNPVFADDRCTYWRDRSHDPNEKRRNRGGIKLDTGRVFQCAELS